MKKVILLFIVLCLSGNTKTIAQENTFKWNYDETISLGASLSIPEIKNSSYSKDAYVGYNVSGCWGLFVHRKPVAKRVKFAVDLGFSADFASLKEDKLCNALTPSDFRYPDEVDGYDIKFVQASLGIRVGPSIVYKLPDRDTFISLYAHFIPSVSSLIAEDEFSFSYIPYNGAGIKVMLEEFGLGLEYIQGKGKFNNLAAKILKEEHNIIAPSKKYIMETRIFRVYLSVML